MSASDPLIGVSVDGYQVVRQIGGGGMGTVYEATAAEGTRVALKLIRRRFAMDKTFRRRFELEAQIAEKVIHPNLVPVISTGQHDGIPYIAQRYIDGLSLEEKLIGRGSLELDETLAICSQVAAGLEALWAAGLVHRDVKPGNILLDGSEHAYITDFGLAKDTQGPTLTVYGEVLGSPYYMAPEQIRHTEVTAATDVYALGCVVYECVCGRTPFADAENSMRVGWAHLQEDPPDPRRFRGTLRPGFARVLLSALAKDPGQRPRSAGDYVRMLKAAAAA
jgi:serine/threonine protein kinase